jgi:hypothetical protein
MAKDRFSAVRTACGGVFSTLAGGRETRSPLVSAPNEREVLANLAESAPTRSVRVWTGQHRSRSFGQWLDEWLAISRAPAPIHNVARVSVADSGAHPAKSRQ